jgi:hypothetical protein
VRFETMSHLPLTSERERERQTERDEINFTRRRDVIPLWNLSAEPWSLSFMPRTRHFFVFAWIWGRLAR